MASKWHTLPLKRKYMPFQHRHVIPQPQRNYLHFCSHLKQISKLSSQLLFSQEPHVYSTCKFLHFCSELQNNHEKSYYQNTLNSLERGKFPSYYWEVCYLEISKYMQVKSATTHTQNPALELGQVWLRAELHLECFIKLTDFTALFSPATLTFYLFTLNAH